MPVVRTDGRSLARCTVTWLPNFLGWVVYHIFLSVVLRCAKKEIREIRIWISYLKSTLRTDFSEVKSIFGFCVRFRISQSNATIYGGLESRDVIWKRSVGQSGLVMSVRLCWHCITWLRQNHFNSAIRHLRNEKGTGAEMRRAIVSGILWGIRSLAFVPKRECKAIDMKMTFGASCEENSFLHLALLWKWDFFWNSLVAFFFENPQ